MEKLKITPVIVVEGKSDTQNLKRFFDLVTYETGGSSLDATDLERLKKLQARRGLIVFTDPDYQGERIRKMIMAEIPEARHAFIRRNEGVPASKTKGHSLGVEHADQAALKAALADFLSAESVDIETDSDVTIKKLRQLGLVMGIDSRQRREFLGGKLRIGYVNGKGLLRRLQMFGISAKSVKAVMKDYENQR